MLSVNRCKAVGVMGVLLEGKVTEMLLQGLGKESRVTGM